MTRLAVATFAMLAFLGVSGAVRAEVPYTLSYQGFLTDAVGNPVTGEWTITFSFYHVKTGGEPFHQETVDVVTQLGLFSVLLGEDEGNAVDLAEFAGGEVYLELSIETDVGPVVLKPRQPIVSNPFAFHASAAALAEDAGKLGGKEPSAFVTVENAAEVCVTPDTLAGLVEALGFVPGPHYTDADVAAYLQESGFGACQCYGDDQVAAYLLASGYVPGPHFSGDYADLAGAPDLNAYVKLADLEGTLAAFGVLLADGSVPVSGNLNFMGKQAVNLVVHNAKGAPANPAAGQLWWETGAKQLKVYDGTQWVQAGGGNAMDLTCPGCVDASDVSFPFAAGSDKGGAALSALDLTCAGCVGAEEVGFAWAKGVLPGGDAEHALTADSATNALTANQAANVTCASCVQVGEIDPAALAGKYVSYDPTQSQLGVTTVQKAIDKLASGGAVSFQEGNGTIVPYVEQWGLPAYGEATTYVHMMNPSQPKLLMHLYAGESSGFATSNNLVVAYQFAPNQYSADVTGNAGETALQVGNPSIFNSGSHVLIHQTVGTGGNGTGAGSYELNQVVSVQGSTLQLVKPLKNTYKSCGDTCGRAQAVVAASYNQLEIVNGGTLKPAQDLDGSGKMGGIVYIRAQKIVVKNGGKIIADGAGFYGGDLAGPCEWWSCGVPGDSQCNTATGNASTSANCTGGGGSRVNVCAWQGGSYCNNANTGGGGGGNKTAGDAGSAGWNSWTGGGAGGSALADGDTKLHFGGGGGGGGDYWCENGRGGDGGGIIVLGATTIIIEKGAVVSANGLYGSPQTLCGGGNNYPVTGSGAGGTIAMFADQFVVDGTVTATGGPKHDGKNGTFGGKGGDGWTLQKATMPGVVNESFAKGVEIWVDGANVTPTVGDPNGKGTPSWDSVNKKWGADGLAAWSTGPLNLTSVVPWTLGEHTIKFKETGGAGGDIKMFMYVIYPFTKSVPPINDTCDQPVMLDLKAGSATVSGTTEDVMGKTKATDANQGPFCGGSGGPDVVYGFTLTEWRQLNVQVVAAFTPRVYIKKDKCLDGDVMACGQASVQTPVLAPGTYYLFVDGDGNLQKGDFKLTVTATPPGPPPNDVCSGAELMNFQNGTAKASGMTLFATNKHSAACGGADAPETVYKFDVPAGTTSLSITVDADFAPVIYLVKGDCGQAPIACIPTNTYSMNWPTSGTYFLFIDGKTAADKGLYTATVTVK